MQIVYVTNGRIPTEKAYGLQTVSMCQAFVQLGLEVTLIVPRRHNIISQDLFSYYNLERSFAVKYMAIIDAIGRGRRFGFFLTRLSYALVLLFLADLRRRPDVVIFTRDLISAVLLKLRGHSVFYDMHGFPYKWLWFWKKACLKMDGIVCTNQWKMGQCRAIFGISSKKLLLARNGYDAHLFAAPLAKTTARKQLGLPQGKQLVVYTGHLYDWKGVDTLAQAAALLPEILFLFVGGSASDVQMFRQRYARAANIIVLGQKPHQDIPRHLQVADVLALPNSARSANPRFSIYSRYDTSPLKLFEYMSAKRPVVASNLPSISEILNENNALLVEPDNPAALADGIKTVLANPHLAEKIREQAWRDVQEYSWEKRARLIVNFINLSIYAR